MKKYITVSLILMILLSFCGTAFGETVESKPADGIVIGGVEVKYLFSQSKKMLFEGESANWNGTYDVEQIVRNNGEVFANVKVTLTPKKYKSERFIKYEINTSKGDIIGSSWLIFGESFNLSTLNRPIPDKDEVIKVKIRQGDLTEILTLKCTKYINVTPTNNSNLVSAEQAVELLLMKYKSIYKEDMPSNYTIFVEYFDTYWAVSYDDNDGIGGRAYFVVDAKTSESGDIKVDEIDLKVQE